MVEHADWESLELCLLNFLEKCEIDSEEIIYPIVANLFNPTRPLPVVSISSFPLPPSRC